MKVHRPALGLGALVLAVAGACTNGGGLVNAPGGGGAPSPLPSAAIGVAIPTGKIGVENDPVWGTVGGYTQDKTSQILAFPPGSTITIQNLSQNTPHTLNVITTTKGPPPKWPSNPSLTFSPSGNGVLGVKYASGSLNPRATVKVKLSNPGIYLIGCAYHYFGLNMRDVIQVVASATPGPTASPGPGGYAPKASRSRVPLARVVPAQPQLIDQLGRKFTLASLRGKPLVLTFIAAHCSDACPLINAQFADAARRMASARIDARLLTVTLDPEHDSPATMRELARRFDANPRYWLLAGGAIADVHAIMRDFGTASEEGRHGYRDEHTTFVYVINSRGDLTQTMLASSALSDSIVEALHDRRLAER